MKIKTNTLGESLAVIMVRYNYSIKEVGGIVNVHPTTLSRKIKTDKFNATERITVIEFIKNTEKYL